MQSIFLNILDMSITAGCVAAVVILVRQLLKRVPKKYSYLLWLVVAFRLVCPVSFSSNISIFNLKAFGWADLSGGYERSAGAFDTAKDYTQLQEINAKNYEDVINYHQDDLNKKDLFEGKFYTDMSGKSAVYNGISQPNISHSNTSNGQLSDADMYQSNTPQKDISDENLSSEKSGNSIIKRGNMVKGLTFVWLVGMTVMAAYGIVSYIILNRKLEKALKLEDRVYRSDRIDTPFVMGFVNPKIYIPCFLDNASIGYVVAHEKCHIRRRDYIVKAAAFVLLCVHWFNPLVWAAFFLMGKDMEMSCDEMVVETFEKNSSDDILKINKDYSYALLCCASAGRFPAPGPLCFGDVSVKGRINNVLNYRRPNKIVSVAAIILCMIVLAACSANSNTANADNGAHKSATNELDTVETTQPQSGENDSTTDGTKVSANNKSTQSAETTTEEISTSTENVAGLSDDSTADASTVHDDLYNTVLAACVRYHMDPQEVWDLLNNASDMDKISIFTQCRQYNEAELDEWNEKMTAYYGDGWQVMVTVAGTDYTVDGETGGNEYLLIGYDKDIVPDLTNHPVYQVPVDNAKLSVGYGYVQRMDGVAFHPEDDFTVEDGSDVRAVADGTVLLAGWNGSNGMTVIIQQNDGYMTHYCHLGSVYVNVGDKVTAGDVIAQSGQSGNVTGPMLSFAVSYYDEETGINFIEPVYDESTYTELDVDYTINRDGTYTYNDNDYKYKLHVSGNEGENRVTYVILTNNLETKFEAVKRSLIGSELITGEPQFIILGWY